MLRDIGSDDGHRECGANAGDHTERRDDVLQRRQRDADDANRERRNISMERWRERSREQHTDACGHDVRQLQRDGDCERLQRDIDAPRRHRERESERYDHRTIVDMRWRKRDAQCRQRLHVVLMVDRSNDANDHRHADCYDDLQRQCRRRERLQRRRVEERHGGR